METINEILLQMYNQGIQDGLDRNMRYKIDELRQKKLTNYQKKCYIKLKRRRVNLTEKEMNRLYIILSKISDPDEKAALRHAIFVLESNR